MFARTGYAVIDGDGPQWLPDHNEQFYTAPEDQLNIGIYYQTRVWLEDFTRSGTTPGTPTMPPPPGRSSPSPRRTGPIQGGTTWRRPHTILLARAGREQ